MEAKYENVDPVVQNGSLYVNFVTLISQKLGTGAVAKV